MVTARELKAQTVKDLTKLARKWGLAGYSAMRKDQLVRALVRAQRSRNGNTSRKRGAPAAKRSGTTARTRRKPGRQPVRGNRRAAAAPAKSRAPATVAAPARRESEASGAVPPSKDLEAPLAPQYLDPGTDQIVLLVLEATWLQACWNITHAAVERARAALADQWHGAVPVLRLMQVAHRTTTGTSERLVRDIPLRGGVRNWFLDVEPDRSYQVRIGYRTTGGDFHSLAVSNIVRPPRPGNTAALREHWKKVAQDCDRVYAMSRSRQEHHADEALEKLFEGRLRRPMREPVVARFCTMPGGLVRRRDELPLEVDAELILYGSTDPAAHVTVSGEPVALREDGTFTLRMDFPNRRQVVPVVALSRDGVEQRTIVLAVERNTKQLDTIIRDDGSP